MEWISVKDKLPKHLDKVLITYEESDNILMASYRDKGFFVYYADGRKITHTPITHWMPLPEPPKPPTAMTEPMKTAEDILFDHLEGGCLEREELEERKDEPWFEETIKAMDEYAALKVAAERERIKNAIRELPVSRVGFSAWGYLVKEDILKKIDSL